MSNILIFNINEQGRYGEGVVKVIDSHVVGILSLILYAQEWLKILLIIRGQVFIAMR